MKQCSKCNEYKVPCQFYKGLVCKVCHGIDCRKRRAIKGRSEKPEQWRRWHLKTKFGITPEQYHEMANRQNNVCAICSQPCLTGRQLAVDHCHKTGRIRGLLCGECNNGIGKLKDDPNLLRKAITYLEIGMEE